MKAWLATGILLYDYCEHCFSCSAVESLDRSLHIKASLVLRLIFADGCVMHGHFVYYSSIQDCCATPPRLWESCPPTLVVCLLELQLPTHSKGCTRPWIYCLGQQQHAETTLAFCTLHGCAISHAHAAVLQWALIMKSGDSWVQSSLAVHMLLTTLTNTLIVEQPNSAWPTLYQDVYMQGLALNFDLAWVLSSRLRKCPTSNTTTFEVMEWIGIFLRGQCLDNTSVWVACCRASDQTPVKAVEVAGTGSSTDRDIMILATPG